MDETKTSTEIAPLDAEVQNILDAAAQEHTGIGQMIKFKKGKYTRNDTLIPIGSKFIAHTDAWVKQWALFLDGKLVDRKLYRMSRGEKPADRETLSHTDQDQWPVDYHSGKRQDPWSFQYMLPLEDVETGDISIFITSSVGGRQCVSDCCIAWAKHIRNGGPREHPIIKLAVGEMKTRNYGDVLKPAFDIVDWSEYRENAAVDVSLKTATDEDERATDRHREQATSRRRSDFDDDIPF